MMKKFNFNAATKAVLGAGLLSLALSGCGSDGKDGEDGKDGVIGVKIDTAKSINAVFTNATVDAGSVTVDFKLENDNGVAILGLTKDHDLRFGIAQLTHETRIFREGDDAVEFDRGFQWQSYINAEKAPNPDWIPDGETNINPTTQFQANVEQAAKCDTCFVDNGDGTYSYTFQQNIADVTTPVAVTYNADYTQRATLELELSPLAANANFDWQPSSGLTEGIQSRDVVSIETCYTCHQPESLELHGGRRINIENCASCHTATSGDPESGNSVDFTYMIHAIHKGHARTTYAPDSTDPVPDANGNIPAPYKVIGYKGSVHDYGKVMYPQKPAADCAACHVTGESAPANADLFLANQSNTACIACHTTMPKKYHDPQNENCISCHIEEGYARSGAEAHGDVMKSYNASQGYSAKFSNIKVTAKVLTFDVQILDDKGEPVAKEFIADPSQYTPSSIYFSWDIDKDYPAYKDGSKYGDRGFALNAASYDATTKTFSIDSSNSTLKLPTDDITGDLALEGKSVELFAGVSTCFRKGGYGRPVVEPVACDTVDDYGNSVVTSAYIQDEPLRFTWNDTDTSEPAKARRAIIDSTKCMGCHNKVIAHYDNGVNCQACHTPDKGLTQWGDIAPTSFAYKAHHASGHDMNAKWGSGLKSETVMKTDCTTCHADSGVKLGQAPERAWRYPAFDGNGEIWVSSDAGSCLSCHQAHLDDAAKSHIKTNGGILDGSNADYVKANAAETCQTCHTPANIMTIHGN